MSPVGEAEGLFGPGSVTWRVDREMVVLGGGTRALLMQLAHPVVAAGVAHHSAYATDPFGRLFRTLSSIYDVAFGSRAQADAAVARINAIHARIRGVRPDTREPYSATDPEALLWVHATLVDTALVVYSRFVAPLTPDDEQAYHAEWAQVAERLHVPRDNVPATVAELRAWMAAMVDSGRVAVTPGAREVAQAVLYPRALPPRLVWDAAHLVSFATLPPTLRRQYGIPWSSRRERGVERISRASRAMLPSLPPLLRYVPQARAADRRIRRVRAGRDGADVAA